MKEKIRCIILVLGVMKSITPPVLAMFGVTLQEDGNMYQFYKHTINVMLCKQYDFNSRAIATLFLIQSLLGVTTFGVFCFWVMSV